MGVMTPLMQCLDKAAGGYLEVPARAIATILGGVDDISEGYFCLDQPSPSSVETRDPAVQQKVLKRLKADCGI
jgi:hypothetical protein